MSAPAAIREVARREIVERCRSRAMRVSSAILLVLVVVSAVVATLSDKGTPTDAFGVVGPRAVALAPTLRVLDRADGRRARIHVLRDRATAEKAVRAGDVDVAIIGGRLAVKESRSSAAARTAQRALAAQTTLMRLRQAGLTQGEALAALTPGQTAVDVLDPGARDRERNRGMLWVGVLILFGTLVMYGQSVAASVTEEKSSRVIELLLTSLSPRRLLAGKVLGMGALGVAQIALVCAAGLLSARIAGGEGLPSSAPGTVALVLGWFILGFAFYSVAYAALGALVSRQEDLEATTAPVNVMLVAGYFGAMAAIQDPNGTWAQIAAFLPPLAPMIVPARVVLGDMGALGLGAAIAVEVVATFALIRVAARIYEGAVMRVGAPVSLRSALAPGRAAAARVRIRVPDVVLQAGAVGGLLGGVVVGTGSAVGVALIVSGLTLTLVYHRRRQRHRTRNG